MFKKVMVLVIVFMIVVLAVQNHEVIQLKALFWKVEASRAIVIVIAFLTGILTGMIGGCLVPRKMKKKNTEADEKSGLDEAA